MTPAARRRLLRLAQAAIVAFVLWRAWIAIGGQWGAFRARGGALRADWGLATLSAGVVLATYALLIEAWRLVLHAWGGHHLPFVAAARIWSVSNLGRYLPGKVWSIAAMGMLSRRAGVPAVAATGSSILVTLVNIAAGFAVLLLTGTRALALVVPGRGGAGLAVAVAAVVTAGLVALPWALPSLARLAVRLARRDVVVPEVAPGRLALVVLANVAAWFGYGAAFLLLARAVLPVGAGTLSAGSWLPATAVFTASYLAGYLALVVPGGLGVRELAMVAVLTGLGLTGSVEAWLLALASRLWLTVLELVPGLLFLARDALARSPSTTPDAPS